MAEMQMRKASRKAVKIKINVGGLAGSGKTRSSLLLAKGLCGDWEKICVIDTENNSSELYSDLGAFWVIPIYEPSPNNYIEAIKTCVKNGIEVIIIDSITHEWEYLLAYQNEISRRDPKKNSYTAWAEITPIHDGFKKAILEAPVHIITTVRKKQEHTMVNENGKTTVQKMGLEDITRSGWDYEVTTNFNVDVSHYVSTSKDRTNLFMDKPPFVITEETGKQIAEWCNSDAGDAESHFSDAIIEINNAHSLNELTLAYTKYKEFKDNEEFINILKTKKATLAQ